jgi:2-hydroxy-3-keto-5-methylthiopentenyl-1-phosphate phosphatase
VTRLTEKPQAVVFLDFDGTITRRDATDAILEAFADPRWLDVEEAWIAGRIGSRECLAAQMDLVTATRDQVDQLLNGIEVDPGFGSLLDGCAAKSLPVHIISDGFDYCIERILSRPGQRALAGSSQIVSSRLRTEGLRWHAEFPHPLEPCAHHCATCKPAAMASLNPHGVLTVFVGDGFSDRHAAACADVVFAKDKLAAFCEQASIPYVPFDTLGAVVSGIEHLLGAVSRNRALPGKVSPVS